MHKHVYENISVCGPDPSCLTFWYYVLQIVK